MHNTKDYPDTLVIRELVCLEYQLKGRYFHSKIYNHAKSYQLIPNNFFKTFMYWAKKVIWKNNLDGEIKKSSKEVKERKEKSTL